MGDWSPPTATSRLDTDRERQTDRPRSDPDGRNLANAIALLLARFALSQMDVPTRQAYVMAVVEPSERTAAAAYTNTARYLTRPIAALIAGPTLRLGLGAPFLIAGTLKSVYDLGLYFTFRTVDVEGERTNEPATAS